MAIEGNKWKVFIGPIITVVVLAGGFIGQYSTLKADILEFKKNVEKIENKLETVQNKTHELELKSAVDNSILNTLKTDVGVIKADVKKLLGKQE